MEMKIDLLNCDSWDKLPDVWKVVKKIRAIDFKDDIADKNLFSIVKDYLSDDFLRPAMMGVNIEKNSITVTDSYKLISIPFNSSLETGVYRINPKTEINDTKLYQLDKNIKFPEYRAIFEKSSTTHKISVYKLKTYIQAVLNGKYCSISVNKINFKYDKDNNIAFNGKFLLEVLDSFLLMGHSELYVSMGSGKMYFSPNQETIKDPEKNIGKHPFALLMKLFNDNDTGLGAYEIDFGTELTAYYCFECDKIFNADGSVANFDINLQNTDLPYINSEHLKLISKVLPKNPTLPILENIKVSNTIATASNLYYYLTVNDVNVEDGIYEVCNGALKNTTENIDNFPKFKINSKTEIAEISTDELSQRFSEALYFVSDDDLRPSMTGVCLKIGKGQNKLISTNAHILYLAHITNEISNKITDSEKEYLIGEPKYVAYFLNAVADENIKVFQYNSTNIGFVTDDIEFSVRQIDAKAPNYEQVIDTNINTIMDFDVEELKNVLNSIKGEDAKKNVYFDFESNDRDKGYFKIKLSEYSYQEQKIEIVKDLNIKIGCTFKPLQKNDITNNSNNSIGLIMGINTNDKNFSFNIKFLKSFLFVTEGAFYFDNRKEAPQYIAKLSDLKMKQKIFSKKVQKQEPKSKQPSKTDVQNTIDALKFLADAGNVDAKNTIESLMFLI
jgi:DNA polymerase III sliding clamp (beta) subunit (PCNA family)